MRLSRLAGVSLGCLLLAGCHHKQQAVPVVVLPPMTQVPVEPIPPPATPPKVPTVTAGPAPEASVTPPKKVKKPRHRPAPAPVVPSPASAAQVASSGTPPAAAADVIGALSTGGESTPSNRDKATALIAASEKRLKTLPDAVLSKHAEVERVRYFCAEATAALKGGDTDGALTLATKAKVLLDELLK